MGNLAVRGEPDMRVVPEVPHGPQIAFPDLEFFQVRRSYRAFSCLLVKIIETPWT